jgi:hypothetical protein
MRIYDSRPDQPGESERRVESQVPGENFNPQREY